MKLYLFTIATIILFLGKGFSQQRTPPHTYTILKVNTPATDSRIEVAQNGDTILVSTYAQPNANMNSRQFIEKTYKGTPFFRNGWYTGVLYFEDGSTVNGTLAYNLVNNLIYYSLGGKADAVEAKPVGFTIGQQTLSKLNAKYNNAVSGYFELIFGGPKVDLLRQYNCIYHPIITGDRTGYEAEGNIYEGSYDKSTKLYLGWNGNIFELKNNNNIYKQFGEYRNAMEKFGKENKLNLKKEADLINLVVHFNHLIDEFEK